MTSYIGSGMLKMSITRKIFFLNYDTWVYTELRHCAVEVFLWNQFLGEVVRGERVGGADEGEQVGLERGTGRIS